jgi:DNA-binding response OmpR family regulator
MAVDVVFDGHDALGHLAVTAYDVVVLDRDIPVIHGDDVCKALVAGGSPTRVLMLTAAGSVGDRVEGLGIGADDYLPKPCDFSELVARIRALVRRPGTSLPPTLRCGEVELDPSRRVATRAGRTLSLNPKEFAILEVLLAASGVVVSAEEILERVWDEAADPFSQAVRTTISRLRAKLGDPPVIETVAKIGYRIAG